MVNYVSAIVFVFLLGPGLILAWALGGNPPHETAKLPPPSPRPTMPPPPSAR